MLFVHYLLYPFCVDSFNIRKDNAIRFSRIIGKFRFTCIIGRRFKAIIYVINYLYWFVNEYFSIGYILSYLYNMVGNCKTEFTQYNQHCKLEKGG